ncbi:hypothetical protein HG531_012591 [Fusarium graminearum]|nr:hypothetical protein HG531_012591 [Fusarium graminearum]
MSLLQDVSTFLRLNLPLASILPSTGTALHAVNKNPSAPPRPVIKGIPPAPSSPASSQESWKHRDPPITTAPASLGDQLLASRCALALELLDLFGLERLSRRVVNDFAVRSNKNLAALVDEGELLSICGGNNIVAFGRLGRFLVGVGQVVGVELLGRDNAESRERFAFDSILNFVRKVKGAVDDQIRRERAVFAQGNGAVAKLVAAQSVKD